MNLYGNLLTIPVPNPVLQTPPLKNEHVSWAINNQPKATRFVEHLEKIFQPSSVDNTELLLYVSGQEEIKIPFVTLAYVENDIKVNPKRKKTRFDLIANYILKELPWK